MFSYNTSEEKVLYQCYSRENFILKIENEGRKKIKQKERMFSFLSCLRNLTTVVGRYKTLDSRALFWRPQYA